MLPGGDPVVNSQFDDTQVRPETYYYHPDHLGSTSWVTDQNGRVHEHVEYFPYGEVWRDPASDRDGAPVKGQRFLFTSKELDEEIGLYYFGMRYYDPVRALWKSVDPLLALRPERALSRPIVLNPYAYGDLNPLRLMDPNGLDSEDAQPGYWQRFKNWVKEKIGLGEKVKAQGEAMQRRLGREELLKQADSMEGLSTVDTERNELNKQNADELVDKSLEAAKDVAEQVAINKGVGLVGALARDTKEARALARGARKPIYLPAWKKVTVDVAHIAERHMEGALTAGRDVFPAMMNEKAVVSAIREAYSGSIKVGAKGTESSS
jgi:RHS repeat-associated protein